MFGLFEKKESDEKEDKTDEKQDKTENDNNNKEGESISKIDIGSTIKSLSPIKEDKESSREEKETSNSEEPSKREESSNGFLQTIGKYIGIFFMTIITGLFDIIKSNWILLLILGIIGFAIYYVYTNAMNFMTDILDLFNGIQPILNSSLDILGSTSGEKEKETTEEPDDKSDDNGRIRSLTKSTAIDDSKTLESTLKAPDKDSDKDSDKSDDETRGSSIVVSGVDEKDVFYTDLTPATDTHTTDQEGYCFIGKDNGIRACAPIGRHEKCMSGEIFPTLAICMDPELRE